MVILAVIFPEADFADLETSAPTESFVTTAGAPICLIRFGGIGDVFKHVVILQNSRTVSSCDAAVHVVATWMSPQRASAATDYEENCERVELGL
jgi:hypothetical protein